MNQSKSCDQQTAQLLRAIQEAQTADEMTQIIMSLPHPYIYQEGASTGIFSVEEFKAICQLEGRDTQYWDLHITLLEDVKKGRLQVWDDAGKTLSIQEIICACRATEPHRYRLVHLPLPANQEEVYPSEISLPFQRRRPT